MYLPLDILMRELTIMQLLFQNAIEKSFFCLNVKTMRGHFLEYRQHLLTLEEGKGKEIKHKIKRMEEIFVN